MACVHGNCFKTTQEGIVHALLHMNDADLSETGEEDRRHLIRLAAVLAINYGKEVGWAVTLNHG